MIETEKKRTLSGRSEEGTLARKRHYHAHFTVMNKSLRPPPKNADFQ